MWELDYKESWMPKNWCFWTVVLEKTLESPLDLEEIQTVHPKGDQSWVFFGRNDAKDETPILWPPDVKKWLIGNDPVARKDRRQGTTEDEIFGWHHRLDGHEFEYTLGIGDGQQGGLACCSPWGLKHDWVTELTDWTDYIKYYHIDQNNQDGVYHLKINFASQYSVFKMFISACQAPGLLCNCPILSPCCPRSHVLHDITLLWTGHSQQDSERTYTNQRLKIPRPASNPFWPDTKR